MEVIFTAVLGEVASRSFAFLIDRYSKGETVDEILHTLKLLLLRARVILEEADWRNITNRAMLQQMNMLRKEMYRGCYALDSFRGNQASEDKTKGHSVSHSSALSKFCPAKRLSTAVGTQCVKELQQVSKNLATLIFHMDEFVTFLKNYPPRYRQPYCMHLIVGLSMFGCQMEMERVMDFLMQIEPAAMELSTGVLPIIGSEGVGKSTLVAHIYNSEKVRDHLSTIVLVTQDVINASRLTTLKDRGVTIHQNNQLNNGNRRSLVIIELSEEVEEVAWKRLYVASAGCLESGSKIIVTSRSSKIMNFGTSQALILNTLPIEAFWYFFKVLTFGSADPQDHPKSQSIALQIAKEMNGSFADACVVSGFLRNNLDNGRLWCMVLTWYKAHARRSLPLSSKCVNDFVLYDRYQTSFPHDTTPKVTLHDVLFRRAKPRGRFEALAYKSTIPPYNSYIISCAVKDHMSRRISRSV